MEPAWEAIIIGSGIGGLTAANLLAQVANMRVLVLEKHSERGGLTHTFRRDGASWDVGLHYVGNLEKGTFERKLFDFLSGGMLHWNRMPDDFERFIYPDFDFAVPSDPVRYEQQLIERFPGEAKSIGRYFRDIRSVALWYVLGIQEQLMPAPLAFLLAQYRRLGNAKATQTTAAYLERNFRSPELKALLASQWGDYGVPPKESAFALHALVIGSYFRGGWFPEGGAGRIARTFERGIEASGGSIRVCQDVTEILIEGGRAVGVKAIDRRSADPAVVSYRAPIVISNAGAQVTYQRLLPTEGDIGRRTAKQRAYVDALAGGVSAVTLYLRLKKPVSTLGIQGENYWINRTLNHDDLDAQTAMVLDGNPQHAYLSFPSAKSGDGRFHTAEIIAMLDPKAFECWRKTMSGQRGTGYAEVKDRIAQGLLHLVESVVPGFSALVQYSELSTPLTVTHFTSHPQGRFYGLQGIPARYQRGQLSPRSPIDGLYLSGSDVASLGIVGAMMGGVAAASKVLGATGFLRIMTHVSRGKTPTPMQVRPAEKQHAVLVEKIALTSTIWRLEFEVDEPVRFVPGQYAKLRVAPFEWRDYSIAAASGKRLTFLISNRTRGDGSKFADTVQSGEATEIELPLGHYHLQHNAHRKVFVATGTGLAPFLPMFAQLARDGQLGAAELYFGCRTPAEDISAAFPDIPHKIVCISRGEAPSGGFNGRVTQALASLEFDPLDTDFYVCGSAAMVADCRRVLERAGVAQILTEAY